MVNTVLLAPQEQNSIQRKNNATTAQMDSKEISPATLVFQDFDDQVYTFIVILFTFFSFFQQFSNWSQKIFKSHLRNIPKSFPKMTQILRFFKKIPGNNQLLAQFLKLQG
jgi:hypothetical protein